MKPLAELLAETHVIAGPDHDVAQWQRDLMARRQSTTAASTRTLRRRLARELRKAERDEHAAELRRLRRGGA